MASDHAQWSTRFVALLIIVTTFGACGDELAPEDSSELTDTRVGLMVGNISVDFMTGTFGLVDTETLVAAEDLGAIHADHAIRYHGGVLFIINRLGADNIQRINPDTFATEWQYSTGAGSNPYDIAVVAPDKAYVPCYELDRLLIVNPGATEEAEFIRGSIDLSTFADDDGIPEANNVAVIGDRAYVTLQRVDRNNFFQPSGDSYLIAIDTRTDQIVPLGGDTPHLVLPYANPTSLRATGDQIWIGCVGLYGVEDGAIIPYENATGTFLQPLVLESELGGDLAGFTATTPLYVVFNDASFEGYVSVVDSAADSVTQLLEGVSTSWDIEADDTYIYVADRNVESPGIRMFRRTDLSEVTSEPIRTGLPPWELQLLETRYLIGQ